MLLGIRTDTGIAEFCLYDKKGYVVKKSTWEADRTLAHLLLKKLSEFVGGADYLLHDITGLFVFRGPGSYTGLRIGITVMNSLAYSLDVPIIGTDGDNWCEQAVKRLQAGENDRLVLPEYGTGPHITHPVK